MQISSQFQTSLDSPEHIAVAERLGYHRAWLQDTPAHSSDVWMTNPQAVASMTPLAL